VTVEHRKPEFLPDGRPGPNLMPDAYASPRTTPLRAEIKAGPNELLLNLKSK
jgi:hypothetical protein